MWTQVYVAWKTHNKQKWLSAGRVWKSLLDHWATSVADGKQLPSFISPAVPSVILCYVSTQQRPMSSPPCKTDLWPALACLCDATVLQIKVRPFRCYSARTGVAMQHWGTDREGMELHTVQSLRQLAGILQSSDFSFRWVQCSLHHMFPLSTKSTGRKRKRAMCCVTAETCKHQSKNL